MARVDASADRGWESEVLSAAAEKRLAAFLEGTAAPPAILVSQLRPDEFTESFDDGFIRIRKTSKADPNRRMQIGEALPALDAFYDSGTPSFRKLKTYRFVPPPGGADQFQTEVIYLSKGRTDSGPAQQNARWRCTWKVAEDPVLRAIETISYEEIEPRSPGATQFEDVTAAVFTGEGSFEDQLMRGVNYWRSRLQGDFGTDVNGLQGIALGDADGDGLDDVYVCQQGGLPNRLYLRKGDGTLRDVSAEAGVDWMELTRSALFVDLDNDGDQDLVVASRPMTVFMENDGTGRFEFRWGIRAVADPFSLCAADFDADADLDVYVCGYCRWDSE